MPSSDSDVALPATRPGGPSDATAHASGFWSDIFKVKLVDTLHSPELSGLPGLRGFPARRHVLLGRPRRR